MSVVIRPATPDDATAIARLHVRTHRATYAPLIEGPYSAPPVRRRLMDWRSMLGGPGLSFVVADDGVIVGFIHAEGERIEPLHVAPSHHRRGLGRALLLHLLDALRAREIPSAIFNVFERNARAIAFYEALGAQRIGVETMTDAPVPYQDVVFRIGTAAT